MKMQRMHIITLVEESEPVVRLFQLRSRPRSETRSNGFPKGRDERIPISPIFFSLVPPVGQ
jgi:hypothetical protein